MYYTVPGKHTLEEIVGDLLILAKKEDKDVFNCLDMMDNATMFKNLKFGPGTASCTTTCTTGSARRWTTPKWA